MVLVSPGKKRWWLRPVGLFLAGCFLASLAAIAVPAEAAPAAPFGLAGREITSPDGVSYTFYSGKVPSFDGLPLAVDVTVPKGVKQPMPLVVMFHGWTQNRRQWQSERITSDDPNVSHWNNVAFAARGYAVINYDIRGWHESCGPKSAAVPNNPATLPAECASREYWIHLADPKWEIHDAQHLIGGLVDAGIAHPAKIGVTGQSYGGGHSWLLALLNNRTVNLDGSISPWTSPKGVPLSIAAAVPQYTWSSLFNALLPNGRANDSEVGSPATLNYPVGVPLQSYSAGLFAGGQALGNGFYSPPGTDPSADLVSWNARIIAGNPFFNDPALDPLVHRAAQEFDRRSPLYLTPNANVPVYQIQGLTDPLFGPVQGLQMRNHVKKWNSAYPIKSFFGDIGHSNASNPADVWAAANAIGNAFFDYYLKGRGSKPAFDVTTTTTVCNPDQSRQTFVAPSWAALSSRKVVLSSAIPQVTSHAAAGTEGVNTDPLTKRGCLRSQVVEGTGVAAWNFALAAPYTLVGQPSLTVNFVTTGPDAELNVRLWDVAPDGTNQTLVSRGTYRHLGTAGSANQVTFQIMANTWQFQPGHSLRLEVTGNDAPFYQTSNVPAVTTISSVALSLPVR